MSWPFYCKSHRKTFPIILIEAARNNSLQLTVMVPLILLKRYWGTVGYKYVYECTRCSSGHYIYNRLIIIYGVNVKIGDMYAIRVHSCRNLHVLIPISIYLVNTCDYLMFFTTWKCYVTIIILENSGLKLWSSYYFLIWLNFR